MAARRYEISLRVLKNISPVSAANECNIAGLTLEIFFNTRRVISYLRAAMQLFAAVHDVSLVCVRYRWRAYIEEVVRIQNKPGRKEKTRTSIG